MSEFFGRILFIISLVDRGLYLIVDPVRITVRGWLWKTAIKNTISFIDLFNDKFSEIDICSATLSQIEFWMCQAINNYITV